MRLLRKLFIWSVTLYALSLPAAFLAGGILFAHPARVPVDDDDLREAMAADWSPEFIRDAREIQIRIADRTHLAATAIGGNASATVIVLHESGKNRMSAIDAAYALWRAGFDVILTDRRAQGESDGDARPLFGEESADLHAIVDRVIGEQWTGTTRIGVFGIADGGTAALVGAALDPRIDAVAAQDPALTARDFVEDAMARTFAVPSGLLTPQTYLATRGLGMVAGLEQESLDATDALVRLEGSALILDSSDAGAERHALEVFDALPEGASEFAALPSTGRADRYQPLVDFFQRTL